jgi:hypothetical protein
MAQVAVGDCARRLLDRRLWSLIRGFWGASEDCHASVSSHGDQLVQNDWWAKKATGWAWQFAIFAVGTLPAIGMIALVSRHPGERDA